MAPPVTLSGSIPAENGLIQIAAELADEETAGIARLAIVIFHGEQIKLNPRKGTRYGVVQFDQIELVNADDTEEVSQALGRALASRTGRQQLPFAVGEQVPGDGNEFPEEAGEDG
jgi:hypothetical protein